MCRKWSADRLSEWFEIFILNTNKQRRWAFFSLAVPPLKLVDMLTVLQDPKILFDLDSRGSGNLDSRTVTVCSGLDFVNISYNNFVAADEKTAKVWRRLFSMCYRRSNELGTCRIIQWHFSLSGFFLVHRICIKFAASLIVSARHCASQQTLATAISHIRELIWEMLWRLWPLIFYQRGSTEVNDRHVIKLQTAAADRGGRNVAATDDDDTQVIRCGVPCALSWQH